MTAGAEQEGPRCRRALSATRAEEIQAATERIRKQQPDKPVHKPRDSLLSWNSKFENFTGFVNWAFLLLTVGGLRLLLENFIKYGIRVHPIEFIYTFFTSLELKTETPSIALFLYHTVPVVFCLIVEKALSIDLIPETIGMLIHISNLIILILIPIVVMHVKTGFSFVVATLVCSTYSVIFLKMWSYIQVNRWCRQARNASSSKNNLRRQSASYSNLKKADGSVDASDDPEYPHLIQYPANLNLQDLYYFLFAPTLCYELNFPRNERIRKRFLMRRVLEVVIGIQILFVIFQQYMVPCVKNSLVPFSKMEVAVATERLLKLAIPNHLCWLIIFYLLFHAWVNLLGEILRFADRSFYSDWWNANNIDTFWRTWNLPVHKWAVRHLYFPLMQMGYSKNIANTCVFLISAFFHEYMVSVPLKTYKIWVFLGMMSQIPLSIVSRAVEHRYGPRWGNIIVWASLIIGQPLCIMIYYHDYVVNHYGQALIENYGHV